MQAQQAALLANKWEEDGYALVDTVRGVKKAKSKAVKPQYPMYNQPTTDYQIGILGAGKAGKKGAFGASGLVRESALIVCFTDSASRSVFDCKSCHHLGC